MLLLQPLGHLSLFGNDTIPGVSMNNEIIHPPHVLARISRRRVGFERDLRRMGFSISTNCGYRLLDDGETLLIIDLMPYPQARERSPGYPIRCWPAPCRILRLTTDGIGARASGWDDCSLMMPGHHIPDIPVARHMEVEIRRRFDLQACRPWKLLRSGRMKGPPLFDDFVFEWTSPLSVLIEIPNRKAGWVERR
jgi:hypothetical protein